jgi:hypothetical protein
MLIPMLRRFLYLDKVALSQYVSAFEGGAVTNFSGRSTSSGAGKGGIGAGGITVSGQRSHQDEEAWNYVDTDEARFDRLLNAAAEFPEELGWLDILDPETDLVDVGIGAMVSWECDLLVPEVIRNLAKSGEAIKMLDMMKDVLPAALGLGLDTTGLPDTTEIEAASEFIKGIDAPMIVVCEDEETDWRMSGKIAEEFLHGELEGRGKVVGKIVKVVPTGRWKPYLTFPGINLLSRDDRRKLERSSPEPGREEEYLSGPAVLIDILAIYR